MVHDRKDGNTIDKDEARTPPSLFKKLDDRFHFEVDVFCKRSNCVCDAGIFYDEGHDALKEDWFLPPFDTVFYGNPPYSNPEPFIKKAYEESLKGATVVMLLPADTSTKAFHNYDMKASEITFIEGRVTFNNPDGTPMNGAPKFGSMVVVFKQEAFDGSPVISSMRWK